MFFRTSKIAPLLEKADQALEAGAIEEALAIAEEAARQAPKSAKAHELRGAALGALERWDEALEAYERAVRLDSKLPGALLGAADLLLGMRDEPEALERGRAYSERGAKLSRKKGDRELEAEFLLLEGMALNQLGNPRAALPLLDAALEILGHDPEGLLERGIALFESCRFEEARRQFEELLSASSDEPWALHYLGLLAERRGDEQEARRRFRQAQELAPEEFPAPATLTEKEFDAAVEAALERLPEPVRRYLSNVAITVEPVPAEGDLSGGDVSPTVLGLFRGSPLADKASMDPWAHFPSSIVLYQRNLERFARDREDLIEEIDVTLIHEVGHFLGFDEDDLAERGLD